METFQPGFDFDESPKKSKLRKRWDQCKQQHPEMLSMAAEIALSAKRRGWNRWSTKGVCEVLRWQTAVNADMGLGLKIDNNHTAFLARDLMQMHPELDGFFELRRQGPRGIDGQIH